MISEHISGGHLINTYVLTVKNASVKNWGSLVHKVYSDGWACINIFGVYSVTASNVAIGTIDSNLPLWNVFGAAVLDDSGTSATIQVNTDGGIYYIGPLNSNNIYATVWYRYI